MLDLSVVPDFLAIGGLVTVFYSLARRTRQLRLGYWLVGWVLILLHIVAQLVQRNVGTGEAADAAQAVSLSSLLLASVTYLWASLDMRASLRGLVLFLLAALPDLLFCVFASYSVDWPAGYLGATAAGFALTTWGLSAGRRQADRHAVPLRAALMLGAYGVQGALFMRGGITAALVWMLCWHYLAVAFCFYRSAPRVTAGVVVTTVSFIAWASVFPLAFLFGEWFTAARVENEAWNLPKFLVATGMIFTLLEGQIKRAEHASLHDALTELPNRRVFSARLASAIRRARPGGGRVGVLVIDLDDFKRVNDTAGHAAGDALLRFVALRLQEVLRDGDTLARLGGDEFAAILPQIPDREAAVQLAGRLVHALQASLEFQGHSLSIGASVGVALYPDDGADETRLYAAADRAMYASKRTRPTG